MIGSMAMHRAMVVAGCLLAAAIAAAGAAALRSDPAGKPAIVQQEARKAAAPAAEKAADSSPPAPATIKLSGRVLDPDGRPLADAKLWLAFQGIDWTWSTRVPQVRTATGPDGRFDLSVSDDDPEVKRALRMTSGWPGGFGAIQVVATAEGYGPAWADLAGSKGPVELRLVRDDVPVEGRLINLEGRPLTGIDVRTLRVEDSSNSMDLYGVPSGFLHSATTGRDGRFRLTGIGRDRRAILGMRGPGIERSSVYVTTGSYPEDRSPQRRGMSVHPARFEHPCKPGESITGVVRDRDTGAPLAGVAVRTVFSVSADTVTDREGRFRLEGLSKDPYYILNTSASSSDQPYITTERRVEAGPSDHPLTAEIVMVRGVVVTGRLIDRANGRPVQGWVGYAALKEDPHWSRLPGWIPAVNNRYSPSPGWHVPSMADGSYRIVVPPGRGVLAVHVQYQADRYLPAGIPSKRHPGAPADALEPYYATVPFEIFPQNFPAVRPVDIAAGTESATYDLTLDSGVVRTGIVRDPEGRPLAGASMIGHDFHRMFELKPLDSPEFTVSGLGRSPLLARTLVFRHADRRLGKTMRVLGTETGPIDVRLDPAASVVGRLVDGAGQPRDGIELRVVRVVDDPTRSARADFDPPINTTTDSDGRFRIDGIVPGTVQKIRVAESKDRPEDWIIEDWTPKPGEVKDLGEIRSKGQG
jgi:hypothetical protein